MPRNHDIGHAYTKRGRKHNRFQAKSYHQNRCKEDMPSELDMLKSRIADLEASVKFLFSKDTHNTVTNSTNNNNNNITINNFQDEDMKNILHTEIRDMIKQTTQDLYTSLVDVIKMIHFNTKQSELEFVSAEL
jgi:hypothetical protein